MRRGSEQVPANLRAVERHTKVLSDKWFFSSDRAILVPKLLFASTLDLQHRRLSGMQEPAVDDYVARKPIRSHQLHCDRLPDFFRQ